MEERSQIYKALETVQYELNKLRLNSAVSVSDIQEVLNKAIDSKTIRVEIVDSVILNATATQSGSLILSVKVTENGTEKYKIIGSSVVLESYTSCRDV